MVGFVQRCALCDMFLQMKQRGYDVSLEPSQGEKDVHSRTAKGELNA